MFLCDSNVWLALVVSGHEHHAAVKRWIDTVDEPRSLIFCRATQQSFLRLLTNRPLFAGYGHDALTNDEAWATYERLRLDYRVQFRLEEPAGLEQVWREFSARPTASIKLWMDAYLAAYARAADYQLATTDGGFRQFTGLDHLLLGSPKS